MILSKLLDSFAFFLLLATVFLLPIVTLPANILTLQATKFALLALGIMLALVLWVVARFNEQRIAFPSSFVLWGALALVAGHALAAMFSGSLLQSFIGFGFERDTTLGLLVLVSTLAAGALVVRNAAQLIRLQYALLFSFLVLAIIQIVRVIIGADIVFPQLFSNDPTATLLGSWNDLAVLSGLVLMIVLSGLALQGRHLSRMLLYIAGIAALFLLMVVNVSSVWVVLLILSILLIIYATADASYNRETGAYQYSFPLMRVLPSVIVTIIAVVFIVGGTAIGERIANTFAIAHLDVRPSWEATIDVGSAVYQENWITGAGPNTFSRAWVEHKPLAVNETAFWNVDFAFGIGLIPTFFITGGVLMGALWVLFLGAFILLGVRLVVRRLNPTHMFLVASFYFGAVYLWVLSMVYVPQVVVLALAFLFTGSALTAASIAGVVRTREVEAQHGYAQGIALTLAMLLTGVIAVGAIFVHIERVYASAMLNRAVVVGNQGDIERSRAILDRVPLLGVGVRSEQLKANLGVVQLAEIVNTESEDIDAQRLAFQEQLTETIRAAQTAANNDAQNYINWLLLADIYAQLIPLNIEGAYENAQGAYEQARVHNPTNPQIPVSLARLALTQEDFGEARRYIEEALALKSNYTDAFFILSQIEISEGNTQEAIQSTASAIILQPDNPGLLFQLGLLYYSTEDFTDAVAVLEEAVRLNPNYANALYFLGLAHDRIDNREAALVAFTRVADLNPDNTEVAAIVAALEEGNSAFTVLNTQESEAPIERDEPPVSEDE